MRWISALELREREAKWFRRWNAADRRRNGQQRR